MAPRATMTTLIARLRGMIFDPEGANQVFSGDDLQGFLDDNRADITYEELTPRETNNPNGSISYLEYQASGGNWEADASLVNSDYDAVVPAASDYRRGVWQFAASQTPPLYIKGACYNLNLAAVAALEQWMARLKLSYDFTADGATFKRSQQLAGIAALIDKYKEADAQATGIQVMTMGRPDVIC